MWRGAKCGPLVLAILSEAVRRLLSGGGEPNGDWMLVAGAQSEPAADAVLLADAATPLSALVNERAWFDKYVKNAPGTTASNR